MSKRAGMVAVVVVLALAAAMLTASTGPALGAPPVASPGRLAFTEAQSSVREITMVERGSAGTAYLVPSPDTPEGPARQIEAPQSGQASGDVGPYRRSDAGRTFVSTKPLEENGPVDPDGEVWLQPTAIANQPDTPVLVTDDDAQESNPVAWLVTTNCYDQPARVDVAFASDRTGNWDIWVVTLIALNDGTGECGPLTPQGDPRQITTDPGDDLWPAWSNARDPQATGSPVTRPLVRSLVFSSTRSDPRGDLYQALFDPAGTTPPDPDRLTQLTQGPAADSQPSPRLWVDPSEVQTCPGDPRRPVGEFSRQVEPRWLAFTSATEVDPSTGLGDPRGGLAVLDLDDPGAGVRQLGVRAASEPAWSPDGAYLAYRSAEEDPDGDIHVARFVRECPPDLAVKLTVVEPTPSYPGHAFTVSLTVSNTGPRPVFGVATLDFTSLLSPPKEALPSPPTAPDCDAQGCTLTVDKLGPYGSVTWSWQRVGESSKYQFIARTPGTAVMTAEVTAKGPGVDAITTNDVAEVPIRVRVPPSLQVAPAVFLAAPAAVDPAWKPAVADRPYLTAVRTAAGSYGVAESHPSFRGDFHWVGTSPYEVNVVDLMYTQRPTTSGLSDVLSSDGSDRRRLADGRMLDGVHYPVGHPAYSPDGRFMAFHAYGCDRASPPTQIGCALTGAGIVVARADGADPQVIYPPGEPREPGTVDVNPAWSADGTRIAFTRTPSGGDKPSAVWVATGFDLSGDPVAAGDLVADTIVQVTTPTQVVDSGGIDEFDDEAAWSPDGSRIAFTRSRVMLPYESDDPPPTAGEYDSDIWVVDLASGAEQPLLVVEVGAEGSKPPPCEERSASSDGYDNGLVCRGGDDRGADWSPDGTTIVYEHTGWLYLADPVTRTDLGPVTGPRSLDPADDLPLYPDDPPSGATSPGDPTAATFAELDWAQDPAWSPDGDRIAFAGQPRGQPDQRGIYWLTVPTDPAAREVREIAQQPQSEIQPDWQPGADLALTLTAAPAAILTGAGSVLNAVVSNEGSALARSTSLTVTLPVGLTPGPLPAGCAGAPVVCAVGNLPSGGSVTLAFPVVGSTAGAHVVNAAVTSNTTDPDPVDNSASAVIQVGAVADVSVAVELDPNPGYVGGPVTVTVTTRNAGPLDSKVLLVVTLPVGSGPPNGEPCLAAAGCDLGLIASGDERVTTITVTPSQALRGPVRAEVTGSITDPNMSNNTDEVPLTVVQPTLRLLPPLGPPGFVTLAVGEDFPPGARLLLTWDPGLNASDASLQVTADGTFDTPIAVLMRDQLGPRTITATRTSGLEFNPVAVDFLVVPRTQQPPDFEGRG